MTCYAVLGGGLMGKMIAKMILETDENATVTLFDKDPWLLHTYKSASEDERLSVCALNIQDRNVFEKIIGYNIVISALPHSVSLRALKVALMAFVSAVDIVGEFPERHLMLHRHALLAETSLLPDMGVAPGLSNICVGRGVELLDETDEAIIYVGGIPKEKKPPLYYQTLYRLKSVLNACLRPVPILRDGEMIEVEPLSGVEAVTFPEPIGTLEAFYTDGLNSLDITMRGRVRRNLAEKTLRYPGYTAAMQVLKGCGMLDPSPVTVGEVTVCPIDLLISQLTPRLVLSPTGDFLVMRVVVRGRKNGVQQTHVFELIDEYDPVTGYTAMARTTCYPAVIAARMIVEGRIAKKGVLFPELLFVGDLYQEFMQELQTYNIRIRHEIS